MKYLIKESQYNNAIDKFISYQFEPHEEKRTREYPESVFWVKDGMGTKCGFGKIVSKSSFLSHYKGKIELLETLINKEIK